MSAYDPASSVPHPDVEVRVRFRLRQLRIDRGLTQAEVAAAAGMAVSILSRLESGARRLTLAHMAPLARALDIDTDTLLAVEPPPDPRVRRTPSTLDGMTIWPLTQESEAGTRVFKLVLPSDRREPMLRTHEGHQWLYVVRGRLRLVLGDDDFELGPGEAAEFSTQIPHWSGVVDGPVELVTIFGRGARAVQVRD